MRELRKLLSILLLLIVMVAATSCGGGKATFNGSKTGDDDKFFVDFEVLNMKVNNEMPLLEGDRVEATIEVTKGSVDILVEDQKGTAIYRGDNAENGSFILEIEEAGTYTFYVSGSNAEGSVHFQKLEDASGN